MKNFADLLDIAVVNLKKENRTEELGNGTFYQKLLKKMLEKMITQYRQWVFRKCLKVKILCNKLQQALVNVLLRFRIYQVALLCDVYSIGEQPQDRPY